MRPMLATLATLAEAPLDDPGRVYEPKYDGIRALITVSDRGEVSIASRLGNDKTVQFPELMAALARWGRDRHRTAVLDGEIVALDKDGQPVGFQSLQDRIHLTSAREIQRRATDRPVAFVAFDLLRDGDADLCSDPLVERRRRLEEALGRGVIDEAVIRVSEQRRGDGRALMDEARANGWEGIIVKDARSSYRPGQRTREWLKLKLVKRQEFVIGGYTEPRGSRVRFGALLLGVPEEGERLRYVGHVGGGFSDKELERVWRQLALRHTAECPFTARPATNEPAHWVTPGLVAEVRFGEWTQEGYLRHPIYLGIRDDVSAPSVRVESAHTSRDGRSGPGGHDGGEANALSAVDERASIVDAISTLEARGSGKLKLPDGSLLELGNLRKPFWPELGISKADLLRYYVDVSPYLLPVIRDRPLVMKRFPDGVSGPAFYQHRAPDEGAPPGVRVVSLPDDDVPSRFVGGGLATLLHMVQLAAISMDPWFSRVQSPRDMDFAAIDLDPMDEAPFSRVRDVARWVREALDELGVEGHLKTSGASGLHVYLPMRPGTSFQAGMLFCQIIATVVAGRHPEAATVERTVRKRDPKTVYVDYLQNVEGKTLACAYSARASSYAGASTPLAWNELDDRLDPREFTIRTLPARLRELGDLWAPLQRARGIDLEAALERARVRHG